MHRHIQRLLIAVALTAVGMSVAPFGQTSETERNREVVKRWFDLINRGEWRQAAELFAPDVQHHLGNWQTGTEAIVRGRQVLIDNWKTSTEHFRTGRWRALRWSPRAIPSLCDAA